MKFFCFHHFVDKEAKKKLRPFLRTRIIVVSICLLVVFSTLFTGCGSYPRTIPIKGPVTVLTSAEFHSDRSRVDLSETFCSAYMDFSISLLKAAPGKNGKLVSPLSVLTALQSVANGADGYTRIQLETVLGKGMSIEDLNEQLYSYYASLRDVGRKCFFDASAVWVTDDESIFTISQDYVDIVSNTFDTQIVQGNFLDLGVIDSMNDWFRQKTNGFIDKIVNADDFDGTTVMQLLNAIAFESQWKVGYKDKDIRDGIFFTESSGEVPVKLMFGEEKFLIKGRYEDGFVKPYKDAFSFVVLLPNSDIDIESYLDYLDGNYLSHLLAIAREESSEVAIPEFSCAWEASLKEALFAMGIDLPFENEADFGKMGYSDVDGTVRVSDVIHKTYIEVNASGTRAGGGSSERLQVESAPIVLNRPFVYMIMDNEYMLPIFIGLMINPQSQSN
ncbi:MAG: serpin family protein [Clostridia bacterium]|nr:serpin family protein [Clostridia bacterium]